MTDSSWHGKAQDKVIAELRRLAERLGVPVQEPAELHELLAALAPDRGLPQEMREPLARVLDALAKAGAHD